MLSGMHQDKPLSARQVASFCQVNLKTAIKWITKGKLKAYKLPDSGVNRIMIDDFYDFLSRYNMPIPPELKTKHLPRLLIVDDEINAITVLKRMLRADEFEITEAVDGFEAGRKIESFDPDIVLLDLRMPGMSGGDVLKNIKKGPRATQRHVIILSGHIDQKIVHKLIKAGASAVLEKPVDRFLLIDVIKSLPGVAAHG